MPFTVTATNSLGAVGSNQENAADALAKYQELQKAGFQQIVVKDSLKGTLTFDQLIVLATQAGNAPKP